MSVMKGTKAIIPIQLDELLPKNVTYKRTGWRMSQACGVRTETGYELSYTYVKGLDMEILRVVIEENDVVPSITEVYPGAFLHENEMHELLGINIENINVDFGDKLYRIDVKTPLK